MKVFHHRVNGRFYGAFYYLDDGTALYLAHRKRREVFQAKNAWTIDLATLREVQFRGISVIGVVCKSGKEKFIWMTPLEDFFGFNSFTHIGDTRQRGLPLNCFKIKPGLASKHIARSMKVR